MEYKKRSNFWFLLPIFFSIFGGIIVYFVIKDDDPRKAKNCLLLGVILAAVSIGIIIISIVIGISLLPRFGMTENGPVI